MNNNKWFIVLSFLIIIFLVNSCSWHENEKRKKYDEDVVGKLAYETDNIIYIKEIDGYYPYIVLTNQYDGKTLLLRKNILKEKRRMNSYSAYYEDCEMDLFLNGEFLERLPKDTQTIIKKTTIQILAEECLQRVDTKTIEIERKVFLLSYRELAFNDNGITGLEGEPLDFFQMPDNRLAMDLDGEVTSWWLRSANSCYASCVCAISYDGSVGSTNSFDLNGVRPAFCVDSRLPIEEIIVDGKRVYVPKGK